MKRVQEGMFKVERIKEIIRKDENTEERSMTER